jgi:hypothetical protein
VTSPGGDAFQGAAVVACVAAPISPGMQQLVRGGLSPQMAAFIQQTSHSFTAARRQPLQVQHLEHLCPFPPRHAGPGPGAPLRHSFIDGPERDDVACSQQPESPDRQGLVVRGPFIPGPSPPRPRTGRAGNGLGRPGNHAGKLGNLILVGSDGQNDSGRRQRTRIGCRSDHAVPAPIGIARASRRSPANWVLSRAIKSPNCEMRNLRGSDLFIVAARFVSSRMAHVSIRPTAEPVR